MLFGNWYNEKMIAVGASALVIDKKGRILLTQRQDLHNWVFPGGGLGEGESLETGLKREILEETGVKIEQERLVAVFILDHWLKRWVHFFYLAQKTGGKERRQKKEVLAIKWVGKKDVGRYLGKRHQQRFVMAFDKNKQVRVVRETRLPVAWHQIPLWWWRRNLGKKLGLVKT